MYQENIYPSPFHVEHEMFYMGEHGGKGEKRRERKRTPEEIARWNLHKRVKHVRRLIQANFVPGDYMVTLKFPKGYRPMIDEVKKCYAAFREIMRKEYALQKKTMKYIYRIEIGERGGVHLHCVMNRLDDGLEIMSRAWRKARGKTAIEDMLAEGTRELPDMVVMDGRVDVKLLYLEGGYQELAEYLLKPVKGEENLSADELKTVSAYGCSRNMKKPEPVRKKYTHWTMRRILEAGPEKINTDPALRKKYLRPGFLIDKNTWQVGTNPVTGMTYLYFTEVRIT